MIGEKYREAAEKTKADNKIIEANYMPEKNDGSEEKEKEEGSNFSGNSEIGKQLEDLELKEELKKMADKVVPEDFRDILGKSRN